MKKILCLLFIFFIVIHKEINAQSVSDLSKFIKEVQLEKEIFGQELISTSKNSTDGIFRYTYTDSKGKSTEEEFGFDLIFFSPVLVKREASKKVITVELGTAEGFEAIKYSKAEKFEKYLDKMVFRFDNANDAKEFEKNVKTAISAAKTKFESSIKQTDSFAEFQKLVEGTIESFEEGENEITQSVERTGTIKDRVKVNSKLNANKKDADFTYDLSWGDLSDKSVETKAVGSIFEVEIQTLDKEDFIKITDNLKNKVSYGNSLKFFVENPKETKILSMTLKKFLPLAKKELQNRLKNASNQGMEALSVISDIELGEEKIEQKIGEKCYCEYSRVAEVKSKSKEEKFNFNFGDLTDFKMKIEKNFPVITAKTKDGQKYIAFENNEGKKSFINSLEFYLPDLESGRFLMANLPDISKKCLQNVKPETFSWLVKALANEELSGITQELSKDDNKWTLQVSTASGKKTIEKTYEFDLSDIDVSKNSIEVEGQNLVIKLITKGKDKLIKQKENDKSSFVNELQMTVASVEEVKKVNATLVVLQKD